MQKLFFYLLLILTFGLLTSCSDYIDYADYTDISSSNDNPNMPSTYKGRPVTDQGRQDLTGKTVTFKVWDGGNQIDGDIITLVVNGKEVISNYTLTASKKSVQATLKGKYNYVLLYAHNVGSSPPNTCAVSMTDSQGEKNIVLSSDLQTNGAMHLYVN